MAFATVTPQAEHVAGDATRGNACLIPPESQHSNSRATTMFKASHIPALVAGLAFSLFAAAASAEQPLHERIDTLIASQPDFDKLAASDASDAEFVRRAYLDLTGVIPTATQVREFLQDPAPSNEKRTQLIDELLASPRHARRLQYVLDEMLIERQKGADVPDADWREYLRQSCLENKPWNKLVSEILAANDDVPAPAAKFYTVRGVDLDMITRDLGRVMLGVNLECAQCHDHPEVSDYYQRHYFGINAFLQRTYVFTDPKTKKKSLGERAEGGEVKFTSVFTQESGATAPRLLELDEMPDPEGTEKQYVVKPSKTDRGVPKYSRRSRLAEAMVLDDNVAFRRNIANRLWAMMMGRGLVEPLDLHTTDNPASHPDVLALMADELAAHDYDLRWMLRELALSQTYQRSSVASQGGEAAEPQTHTVALLKALSPEQLAWSVMQATGVTDNTLATKQAQLEAQIKKQEAAAAAKAKQEKEAAEKKAKAEEKQADEKKADATKADDKKAEKKAEGSKADNKTPEEQDKKPEEPKPLPSPDDPLWQEETLDAALNGNVQQFVTLFASEGGQRTTFEAAPNQALFFINGTLIRSWLTPSGQNLTARLKDIEEPEKFADELFLSILSRPPSKAEMADVIGYLEVVGDRTEAAKELAWALLGSAEFRFNH